ncbi:UNVERIFIED_CONTAM: hypothetical protein Sindi_1325600 [Sesamum indicum]
MIEFQPTEAEWINSCIVTVLKIKIKRTDWKELELDTSKISQDMREIQKTIQDYGHRLIHIPMKMETLSQTVDEILKILLNLHKDFIDLKEEITDLKRNNKKGPETSKSRQERIRTPLEQYLFYIRKGRPTRFQRRSPEKI